MIRIVQRCDRIENMDPIDHTLTLQLATGLEPALW